MVDAVSFLGSICASLFDGEKAADWPISKLTFSVLGGFAWLFYLNQQGNKIRLWGKGLGLTLFGGLAGFLILQPSSISSAFIAGLVGWATLARTIQSEGKGLTRPRKVDEAISPEQISDIYKSQK